MSGKEKLLVFGVFRKEGPLCYPIYFRRRNSKVVEVDIRQDENLMSPSDDFNSVGEIWEREGGELLAMQPEYGHIPLMRKKFFCLWSDWNLNLPVFLQNVRKFKAIFVDGAGARRFAGRIPCPVYSFPVFALYARCSEFLSGREGEKGKDEEQEIRKILERKSIDVIFLGNMNPGIHAKRNQLLRKILLLPPEYRVVVGLGIYNDDLYCDVIGRAKVVFNRTVRKEMNMRVFEAIRTFSLLLLEEDNEETWDYFEKWSEVIPYNEENLPELVKRYVDDTEEREKVVRQAFEKVRDMTSEKMWGKLIEAIYHVNSNLLEEDSIRNFDFQLKLATFRSFVNSIFNYLTRKPYASELLEKAEREAFELIEQAKDNRKKAEILNDLSFVFFSSMLKLEKDDMKALDELIKKATRYINSALAFYPSSVIIWFNSVILSYSIRDRASFLRSAKMCLKLISEQNISDIMGDVSGFPEPNFPFLFLHYDYFKREIELIWHRYFDNTEKLREEILKVISSALYFSLGKEALANGDFKEAENFFLEVIRRIPDFADAYYGMGIAKFNRKEFVDSARVMLKAYELDPLNVFEWGNVIAALSLSRNREKLERIFQEMNTIASRLYITSGMNIKLTGKASIRIKSVNELVSELRENL